MTLPSGWNSEPKSSLFSLCVGISFNAAAILGIGHMTDKKPSEPEKLDLASADIAAEKRSELLRLFPEARTEGDKIDFAVLERALGKSVDPGKERYGLSWP